MILMDIGDKFLNDISMKNFVILITCVIKDVNNKFYQIVYLVETSVAEKNSIEKEDSMKDVDKNI